MEACGPALITGPSMITPSLPLVPATLEELHGPHLREAGPVECVQPCSYPGYRRVEDGVHNPIRSLRISRYAV